VTYNRPVPRHGMLVAAGRDRHAALFELLGDERHAFPKKADLARGSNIMSDSPRPNLPKQLLHLVLGGEVVSVSNTDFKDLDKVDIVGVYPNYATAYAAWKAKAQGTVDNAEMRYFIVHLHRLLDPESQALQR
jgi:hypothetical protein